MGSRRAREELAALVINVPLIDTSFLRIPH